MLEALEKICPGRHIKPAHDKIVCFISNNPPPSSPGPGEDLDCAMLVQ